MNSLTLSRSADPVIAWAREPIARPGQTGDKRSMQFVTDFADQAVVLPALGLTCIGLLATGWRRAAVATAMSALAVAITVGAGKMMFMACPALTANAWGLRSPSGHTAMAGLLCGGLVAISLDRPRKLAIALAGAFAAAGVVGLSRLALAVHSTADVMVGTVIAALGVSLFVLLGGPRPAAPKRYKMIVAAVLCVAFLFHGQHLNAEERLHAYASRLSPPALCQIDVPNEVAQMR